MKKRRVTPLRILVHLAGWMPLALILYDFYRDNLTANPIQAIEQRTGLYALTFLVLSLACTPLSAILGWHEPTQRRKALGLYGFMYASLHLITVVGLDYGFNFYNMQKDLSTKWYIFVGLAAFLLLVPLAITSFDYWVKRMGKSWKRLHMLVYIISPLVVFHFLLVVKGNLARLQGNLYQPLLYGGIVALLLILRIRPIKRGLIAVRMRIQNLVRTGRVHAQVLEK